jgi:molybdopterin-containing oxidoreductase family iron-sulfur binding subunit
MGRWATRRAFAANASAGRARPAGAAPAASASAGPARPTGAASPAGGDADWRRVLIHGGEYATARPAAPPALRGDADLPPIGPPRLSGDGAATLLVPFSPLLYDGRGAHLDWLREVPDSVSQTAWDIPVEIAADVARRAQIQTGDLVRLASPRGEARGSALVTDDLVAGTVALRPGAGLTPGGPDPRALLEVTTDAHSGELALLQTRVSVTRLGPGQLVRVIGSDRTEDRHLCLSVDLADARAGRYPVLTRHGEEVPDRDGKVHGPRAPLPHEEVGGRRPPDNMVPLQAHPQHRFGMTVDLDRCTGCGACVVACYAENNIPVVGREEVARGRELSWIRIERHAFAREPGVRFLPVMCQHCAQAPCETVCPVFASYHTPDGLNAQVYNRCVGTRYCANNCPYKVRRFNWFDYRFAEPEQQRLNPDVTVRSRGVMEKCTFCIQRIREVKGRAALEHRPVREGEIVPACVQTCPTGALAFGDYRQPGWRMTKLARDPRGYRLLDAQVNTRPGVVYLRKVISPAEGA